MEMVEYSVELISREYFKEYDCYDFDLLKMKTKKLINSDILKKYNFELIEIGKDFKLYKLIKNERMNKNYYVQHFIFVEKTVDKN